MKTQYKPTALAISLFFVILYSYTATVKLAHFRNFQSQLNQSPGLQGYGGYWAYGIIALIIVMVILLCFRKLRLWGLWCSFGILTVIAGYIAVILYYSNNLPCTCIGLFEQLGWKENLIVTIVLMIITLVGIYQMRKKENKSQKNKKSAPF